MNIQFLRASEVNAALVKLIKEQCEFHWAVAWGSWSDTAEVLLKHKGKFRNVCFGVDFSHTDPDLINKLVGVKGARVAIPNKWTFHPKVYGFRSGDNASAIVGSANFTKGGLGKNVEAAVLFSGKSNDPFFVDLFGFTTSCMKLGKPVTKEFAKDYRVAHEKAAKMPKPSHDPFENLSKNKIKSLQAPMISWKWDDYAKKVKDSKNHELLGRLEQLRVAQRWFASVLSFSDLSIARRKAIAGLPLTDQEKKSDPEIKKIPDWGWFGSMKGLGTLLGVLTAKDGLIVKAIDGVPLKGEVTQDDFDKFVNYFNMAFKDEKHKGGFATASRLLAMKRPDTFLCVCRPNLANAAEKMAFSKSTLDLGNYWDRVVEVVRNSKWYNVAKPDGEDGALWEYRAAMLDAIFYQAS